MSNEKIDEIIELLNSPAPNETKKPKGKKKVNLIRKNNDKSQNIQIITDLYEPEKITKTSSKDVKLATTEELIKRVIEEKLNEIKVQRKQLYSVTESKSKEVLTLKTILKDAKKQKADLFESIAAIDARRAELVKNCEEKKKNIGKLEKKIKRAEDLNMKTLKN